MLFPGGRLPLRVFEKRYIDMARECLRGSAPFGVCLIVEGREVGDPAVPASVGTLAKIVECDMAQLGVLQIVAQGERRFKIAARRVQPDGLVRATVELLGEEADAPVAAERVASVQLLQRIIAQHAALFPAQPRLDSSAWVSARLAELLPLPLALKQELLEMDDAVARLARVHALLAGA